MSKVAIIFIVIIMVAVGIMYSIEDSQKKILNQSNGIEVFFINKNDESNVNGAGGISEATETSEASDATDLSRGGGPSVDQKANVSTASALSVQKSPYKVIDLKIKDKIFKTDVSDTTELLRQGLSGRASIGENDAMLFVFDKSGFHSFWMKDMNFSIDIIWINEQKKIVHIEKEVSPESFPQSYQSNTPAKYVLEVKAGMAEKNNFQVGDNVNF